MVSLVTKKDAQKLNAAARKTRRDPSAENVHKLRVLIRKLRSQLWMVSKKNRTKAIKTAHHDLKTLAGILGDQRMYDVALGDAKAMGIHRGKLKKGRRKAQEKIPQVLKGRDRARIQKDIKKAIRDSNQLSASALIPRIDELKEQLTLPEVPKTRDSRHHLRLSVKRARYVLKNFGYKTDELHDLQDKLGRWHDLTTLEELVGPNPRLKRAVEASWKALTPDITPALSSAVRSLTKLKSQVRGPEFATGSPMTGEPDQAL